MQFDSEPRLDRSKFSVGTLTDDADETAYWWSQSPEARLAALEFVRRVM